MLAAIPVWVPAVFLLMLLLGYRQSLARTVRPATLAALALAMVAFSLFGVVSTFGVAPWALALWAAGYLLAAIGGAARVSSAGMAALGDLVHLPGSWIPMALLLGIFGAKFALGFAAGVHSPLLHSTVFVAAMSAVLGMLSGGFGARALAVRRFAGAARAA